MVNRPGFFKFYLPSLGEENLKIPSRFIQSVQGTWPMDLALRDRYNNLWNVKVEMVGGDWYFKDGWTKFADDNMIKGGDMLVYEYFSPGLLDFKVHGGSACLTEGFGGRETKNIEEQIIKIESDDDIVTRTNETDYDPIDEEEYLHDGYYKVEQAMDDDTDDYDSTTKEENLRDDHFQVVQVTDDDTDDDGCLPTTKEANQRDAHPVGKQLMNVSKCVQIIREEGPRDDTPQQELVRYGTASSSKHKNKRDYDWYGVEIFKTGLIPQPRNPYFVTKKRRHRAGELYIPMDVIRCYNLKLPETVTLLDPKGRQFRATRKIWADERTFYFGGWKGLCGVNMVEDEDSCICEFLQNGDDLRISVSFFPPK
ncbi:B3 domain-containing protein At5g60142-like [Salvia miltiorrhiza]|uniref:B3 domain-containing protein At5g60142-like n=1 Tax=Salvia miltiorrhiza TaxID=226208 RepID=UPI0025AC9940|nr:B3 domain-containing protein At5g60142-like [Salvia miltiorrhiza]